MRTIQEEIERQRATDEYRNNGYVNVVQLPGETYEENLRRRAALALRQDELLSKICDF